MESERGAPLRTDSDGFVGNFEIFSRFGHVCRQKKKKKNKKKCSRVQAADEVTVDTNVCAASWGGKMDCYRSYVQIV